MPCNSSCSPCGKRCFDQCMTLTAINDSGNPVGNEFTLNLTLSVQGKEVILRVPAFTFAIDNTNEYDYYSSGANLGTISGHLPTDLRPDTLIHQAVPVVSNSNGNSILGSLTDAVALGASVLPVDAYTLSLVRVGGYPRIRNDADTAYVTVSRIVGVDHGAGTISLENGVPNAFAGDNSVLITNSVVDLALYVCHDGSIRIANPQSGSGLIPNGTYRVATSTISYLLPQRSRCGCKKNAPVPPTNVRVTPVSNSYIVAATAGQRLIPLEYEDPFFYNGKIGLTIPTRPAPGTTPFNNLQCDWVLQTATASPSGVVSLNAPTTVSNLPGANGGPNIFHHESSIRINPNNQQQLAAITIQSRSKGTPGIGWLTAPAAIGDTVLHVTSEAARLMVPGALMTIRRDLPSTSTRQVGRVASVNTGTNEIVLQNPLAYSFLGTSQNIIGNSSEYMLAISSNGGATWSVKRIDNLVFTDTPARSDPNIIFDDYGNLWFTMMYANAGAFPPAVPSAQNSFFIGFAVSQDGGASFTEVGKFINSVDNIDINSAYALNDYPRMAFGGDGAGGKALWWSVRGAQTALDRSRVPVAQLNVGYFKVAAGNIGGPYIPSIGPMVYQSFDKLGWDIAAQNIGFASAGELIATPEGKVFIHACMPEFYDGLFSPISMIVNEKGTVDFGPNSFSDWRQIYNFNMNTNDGAGGVLSYTNRSGFEPVSYGNNAYDPDVGEQGRIYYFMVENVNLLDQTNQAVSLIYSDNLGITWSKRIKINDVDAGVRAHTHITRDPVSGGLLLQWFDARNATPASPSVVDTYIAVLTKAWLDALPPVCADV